MTSTMTRRPLPALVALVALLILTAIVWWRVVNRDDSSGSGTKATPSPTPTCTSGGATSPGAPVTTKPSEVTVQVLNSTSRSGIAAKARQALLKAGFRSPHIATNDSPSVSIRQSAQIRFGPSGKRGAQLLQYYFPGSVLKQVSSTTATVVVSLGDAYQSVASSATVQAALDKTRSAASSSASANASTPAGC